LVAEAPFVRKMGVVTLREAPSFLYMNALYR
jgi:hypothetical protein